MVKKLFVFILLIGLVYFFINLIMEYNGNNSLNFTAAYYAENSAEDVGAANIVSAVVVTYRGLDTLGEVTILFLSAAVISFFLKNQNNSSNRNIRESSELLNSASSILISIIFLFGVYVFLNGHLTPGGGFQGGAIIASGVVLLLITKPNKKVNILVFTIIESISGFAYVGIGVFGIILAGGFLDNRILPLGEFGTLLSAGMIPVINILIGLKVGAEFSGILIKFQQSQEEH